MTYWYTVIHYATPDVIREGHHVSLETVLNAARQALSEGYEFRCGID